MSSEALAKEDCASHTRASDGMPLKNDAPRHDTLRSAHARYAAHAATVCGYGFRSLDGDDGYLFEVRDGARGAMFAAGAGSPYAMNDVRAASIARDKAFCAEVLRQAGVPVLPGRMFFVTKRWADMRGPGREPEDALAYARDAEFPLFCKPLSASNGLHAEVIETADAFADYMQRVAREHFAILVQPYVRAIEHRAFVLDGRVLFSYQKSLPKVRGDGRSTLRALIEALPRDHEAPTPRLVARDKAGRRLSLDDVLESDLLVDLEGPANRAAGGGASKVRDGASEALAHIALEAADAIGLRLAAVDVFDRSAAGDGADLAVIEVNSNPMLATLEENGRWDLIAEIWRANFAAALR
jgi:glutathione synthase/RimK-type ligase-like ATP-grasp enzyme